MEYKPTARNNWFRNILMPISTLPFVYYFMLDMIPTLLIKMKHFQTRKAVLKALEGAGLYRGTAYKQMAVQVCFDYLKK